jgi:hypothetical protein
MLDFDVQSRPVLSIANSRSLWRGIEARNVRPAERTF